MTHPSGADLPQVADDERVRDIIAEAIYMAQPWTGPDHRHLGWEELRHRDRLEFRLKARSVMQTPWYRDLQAILDTDCSQTATPAAPVVSASFT